MTTFKGYLEFVLALLVAGTIAVWVAMVIFSVLASDGSKTHKLITRLLRPKQRRK